MASVSENFFAEAAYWSQKHLQGIFAASVNYTKNDSLTAGKDSIG